MSGHPQLELAEPYALGALGPSEVAAFEEHLLACPECARAVEGGSGVMTALAQRTALRPPASLRDHVLAMAHVPRGPIDVAAYAWDEVMPGLLMHTLHEDLERGIRAVLVWAKPGVKVPAHRHLGDEDILVLQGGVRDHRSAYGVGEICRSRAGSEHSEEALAGAQGEDCICYVVYFGGHQFLDDWHPPGAAAVG